MGHTTPSIRMVVRSRVEDLLKLAEHMEPCEKRFLQHLLGGIDDTLSLYNHTTPPLDPLEVILVHIVRRLAWEDGSCGGMDSRRSTGEEGSSHQHSRYQRAV